VSGTTAADLIIDEDWNVVVEGEKGEGEEIVGGYTWPTVEDDQRASVGLQVACDFIPGLTF